MSIYLSASLLDEYISCNRKPYYRMNRPETSIQTKEMVIGEIVHSAIENYWDNEIDSQQYLSTEMASRLPKESLDFASTALHNYHEHFQKFLTSDDKAEFKFKLGLPFDKDVFVVGKMDRVSYGKVFDWKTARTPATNINKNIQFVLYNWAYKKLFNSDPSGVYYAALTTGKLIKFGYDKSVEDMLIYEIIPQAIHDIRNKNFTRNGFFRGSCYRCQYFETCMVKED